MTVVRTKSQRIIEVLRGRIVRGAFPPGQQLPTLTKMQDEFGVTRPTLTRAVDQLKRDGLVFSDSTRGTFVAEHPPHLRRYAVVFGVNPGDANWNLFWRAITEEVQRRDAVDPVRRFPVFFDVHGAGESEAYQKLRRQVLSGRVAGLIVVGMKQNNMMEMPELVGEPGKPTEAGGGVPRVAIYGEGVVRVPTVSIDTKSFVEKSLDAVVASGRKSVAVITSDIGQSRYPEYRAAIEARGLGCEPHWLLQSSSYYEKAANNLARLLLAGHARKPDALIVTDDNLVPHVMAGVIASRTTVPDDLLLVTHCNWPTPIPVSLPTVRLGFDVRELFQKCVDCIDRQRRGEPCAGDYRLPAYLEDEVRLP